VSLRCSTNLRYGGDPGRLRVNAAEMIGLNPGAVVTSGGAGTRVLQQLTRTIAIVMTRLVTRGAKVNDLLVEFPTRFQLVVNLKIAEALGIDLPLALLLRADEVIE
jgi:ABC-type uncharacterized transport system substrate-binding protein